jgi:hypothetical protein
MDAIRNGVIEYRCGLLRCVSPFLAHFGRHSRSQECLLLGEERKSRLRRPTSESDPTRTMYAN